MFCWKRLQCYRAGCEEEHRSDLDRVQHEAEGRSEKDVQRPGQKGRVEGRKPLLMLGSKQQQHLRSHDVKLMGSEDWLASELGDVISWAS